MKRSKKKTKSLLSSANVNRNNNRNIDLLTFQHFMVVYLDILGQKNALRQITALPSSNEETEEFVRKIKGTLGRVDSLRNLFDSLFHNVESSGDYDKLIPPEYKDKHKECQKTEAYYYGFSDSIIIAVPLMNSDMNCTAINGVYHAFGAASAVSLLSLSAKMPLRAGLDVGIAAQINHKEIYGPALERAYFLESRLAEYPRLTIGDQLINYLNWVDKQEGHDPAIRYASLMARRCKNMIILDTDGRPMLDFMGHEAKELYGEGIKKEVINDLINFIDLEYIKYKNEDNFVLASRYYRLKRYIASRANNWVPS